MVVNKISFFQCQILPKISGLMIYYLHYDFMNVPKTLSVLKIPKCFKLPWWLRLLLWSLHGHGTVRSLGKLRGAFRIIQRQ